MTIRRKVQTKNEVRTNSTGGLNSFFVLMVKIRYEITISLVVAEYNLDFLQEFCYKTPRS